MDNTPKKRSCSPSTFFHSILFLNAGWIIRRRWGNRSSSWGSFLDSFKIEMIMAIITWGGKEQYSRASRGERYIKDSVFDPTTVTGRGTNDWMNTIRLHIEPIQLEWNLDPFLLPSPLLWSAINQLHSPHSCSSASPFCPPSHRETLTQLHFYFWISLWVIFTVRLAQWTATRKKVRVRRVVLPSTLLALKINNSSTPWTSFFPRWNFKNSPLTFIILIPRHSLRTRMTLSKLRVSPVVISQLATASYMYICMNSMK